MRTAQWISIILTLCLLVSIGTAGLSEALPEAAMPEESAFEEAEVELADAVDCETGLVVDDGSDAPAPIDTDALDETTEALGEGGDLAVDAPVGMAYMEVAAAEAPVYEQANDTQAALLLLHAGDLVLATGESGYYTAVAFYAGEKVWTGFMQTCDLLSADSGTVKEKIDVAAASGPIALYNNDINLPLVPLAGVAYGDDRDVLANLPQGVIEYSKSKVYTINGVQISVSMFPEDKSNHNCMRMAKQIYKMLWGCEFNSKFVGNSETGLNLIANLNDEQRRLTAEHMKVFIQNTEPGATIRICQCSSQCKYINSDTGHSHMTHSLIVVDKSDKGFVTFDSRPDREYCLYYTWEGFYVYWGKWRNYSYVKYIKWPGAKQLPADAVPGGGKPTPTPTTQATSTPPANVAVTGVKLDQTALTLEVGGTATLVATVEPSNATDASVTWSSSDETVAKVEGGTVTAVKAGEAKITVKTTDGGKEATCTVQVKASLPTKELTKTGSNGTIKLAPGEQVQLTAPFATKRGWKLKSVKSSKSSVATVDKKTGIVTPHAAGKTTITIITKNKKKATLKVVVEDPSVPSSVKLSRKGTIKMKVGQTLKLQAAVWPTTATTTYTWRSSKPKIASVDQDGNVKALKKGTCYIAVRTANGKIAKVKIKVRKK